MTSIVAAATWQVTSYGDDPNDTTTLRGALHAARDGDDVDLTHLAGVIVLTHGAAQVERELPVIYSVTIRGPGTDKLAIDGNSFSTVFHIFTGATVSISGLTIQNGLGTTDSDSFSTGGGIRNSGTLTLSDCAISHNAVDAGGSGGGILNLPDKTLTITNCILSDNTARVDGVFAGQGGAILNLSNESFDPSQNIGGTVTISNSTISNNSANEGGGIYNAGTLTITNTTLSNNTAKPDFDDVSFGGAIMNVLFGTVTLTGVTVSGNSAEGIHGLGGGLVTSNVATVIASTFMANNPDAIWNDTTLTVTNSTFWANKGNAISTAFAPSGYRYPLSSATVVNSTIVNNGGYGIANAVSNVYLKNSILARNAAGNCLNNAIDDAETITSQDHNISDDTTCASFLEQPNDFAPHTDPGLDSGLKNNGGPTPTLALTLSSVAVDAIAPADCAVSTDQRGVSRPQGTNCDIGAFEATPDFDISPIGAINVSVGASGTATVKVNSYIGFHSPITLSTSSVPTGIATAFSPDPVTPASYSSASSILSANIGPAVIPATYRVGVTGTSGALSHSTSLNIIVGVTTTGVIQVVNADAAAGCIDNAGVANAVGSYLGRAQAYIDAGDFQNAKSVLNDLLALLQAQRGKHIHTTCTINSVTFDPDAVLIADVQALLATL